MRMEWAARGAARTASEFSRDMKECIRPTSRSMKRASEVLRSKMCVAQRLPTERVDNLQHLHVLVKAGSRLRENRYQIYRVLLLLLSLHNSETTTLWCCR